MNQGQKKLAIYIVERKEISRTGFKLILEKDPKVEVVGDSEDFESALPEILKSKPSIVLVGVEDSEKDSALCENLKKSLPETDLMVMFGDDFQLEDLARFLSASVSGFTNRAVNIDGLTLAIRTVAMGGLWFSPAISELVRKQIQELMPREPVPMTVALTDRELEILKRLINGYSNPEIAEELKLSIETIKTYIRRIMDKSQIRNRRHLVSNFHSFRFVNSEGIVYEKEKAAGTDGDGGDSAAASARKNGKSAKSSK